jgi:two-component sensor histidine kinase
MKIDLSPLPPCDTVLFGLDFATQQFTGGRSKPFTEQLRQSCLRAIAGLYRPRLVLHLAVLVNGDCPEKHQSKVLLAAGEMTANAIRHGLHERSFGRIDVNLTAGGPGRTLLESYDNGWGFGPSFCEGRGWRLLRSLGSVSVEESDKGPGSLVRLRFD